MRGSIFVIRDYVATEVTIPAGQSKHSFFAVIYIKYDDSPCDTVLFNAVSVYQTDRFVFPSIISQLI